MINNKMICYNCFKEKKQSGTCPYCGYDNHENTDKYPTACKEGSILNEHYIIGRVLGQGGFGITYIALDSQLNIKVAVKEYLPDGMATRLPGTTLVSIYAGEKKVSFDYGAECFLDEARVMAKFLGNKNIVGVRSYFNENNTSYFVMDYIEGISLKNYIKNHGGKLDYHDAVRILAQVMDALIAVHMEGFIHRDVTPDNIYITKNDEVKLLDFGSARYSLGDKSKSLDVILKAGYAPKEQYIRRGKQGPYTDIYSLAACFYASITGYLPPEALERMENDEIVEISTRGIRIPYKMENAIMKGLEVRAEDRFQNMEEFKAAIVENTENDLVEIPTYQDDDLKKTISNEPKSTSIESDRAYKDKSNNAVEDDRNKIDTTKNDDMRFGKNAVSKKAVSKKAARYSVMTSFIKKNAWVGATGIVLLIVALLVINKLYDTSGTNRQNDTITANSKVKEPVDKSETLVVPTVTIVANMPIKQITQNNNTPLPTSTIEPTNKLIPTYVPTPTNASLLPTRRAEPTDIILNVNSIFYAGNTSGNISNGGMVVQQGDWVYYSAPPLDYCLYKMKADGSHKTKISTDYCGSMAIADDWIYFRNCSENYKLYKMKTDGSQSMKINDIENCGYINVVDDWIYCSTCGDDNEGVYKIRTDGSKKIKLKEYRFDITVLDGWIYSSGALGGIYKMKADGSDEIILTDDVGADLNILGDWIYYINNINKNVYKIRTDGSGKVKLSNDDTYAINVSGNWIYYVNIRDDNHIYKIKTDGSDRTKVNNGNYAWLYLVNGEVFDIYDLNKEQ